jgi:peptide/nickel transport system permease protein
MFNIIVKRIILLIPILFLISIFCFSITYITPGDAARNALMGDHGRPTTEEVQEYRAALGLDKPLYVQYFIWLDNVLHGNFGYSLMTNEPVAGKILNGFSSTLKIAIFSMALSLLIAIPAGVLAAITKGTWIDSLTRFIAVVGVSMPSFWEAYMLIIVFALMLHWFPVSGYGNGGDIEHMVLPVVLLGTGCSCTLLRLVRSSMLETLAQEYITGARAKGLPEYYILVRHALKNAFIPVLTYIGMTFGGLLSGAVIVETIFGWPGIGCIFVEAIKNKDFPMIQGCILFIAVIYLGISLAVDLMYVYLNPRIRYEIQAE